MSREKEEQVLERLANLVLSDDQPLLLAVAAGSALAMIAVIGAAGGFAVVTIPGVIVAVVLLAAHRDSQHATAGLALLAVLWMTSDHDPLTPWTLVVAALLLVAHAALALRSAVPPRAPLDRALLRQWALRCGAVFACAIPVYLAAVVVTHAAAYRATALVAVAAVSLVALVLVLRRQMLAS